MAGKTSRTREMAESAEEGVTIEAAGRVDNPLMPLDDLDTEESWDSWIDDLKTSEASGTVRVYKLPLDSDGNPTMAKGARQILLMSCPHQQYSFDDLIDHVKLNFLQPGEMATLRILGTRSGHRGVMFNRMVPVQRAASGANHSPESAGSNVLGVIQAMQTQTRQQTEMLERIMRGERTAEPAAPKESIKEWLTVLAPIAGPIITAWLARPAPKSDLEGLIGAMVKLKDLTGDGGGSGNEEDTTLGIVKAVAGPGLQLLNTLAQNHGQNVPHRIRHVPASAKTATLPPANGVATSAASAQPVPESPPVPPASQSAASETDPMLAQLAPQLEQLAAMAEQGADPAEVAKLVMDMLPNNDDLDQRLYGLLSDTSSFARLKLMAPKMQQFSEWFEKLRVAMLAEFEEEKT